MRHSGESKEISFEIIQSLRRIYKTITAASQEIAGRTGVTLPQAWALLIVSKHKSMTLRSLAEKMMVRPSTASVVVDKLVNRGYLTKDRNGPDQRTISIALTEQGRAIVANYPKSKLGNLSRGLDSLNPAELKEVSLSLRKLVEILDVQNMDVTFLVDDDVPESTEPGRSTAGSRRKPDKSTE